MKQQLFADDCASLNIIQSLADRCKKIHAGDEVIQVNHQTVVRLFAVHSFSSHPHLNIDLFTRWIEILVFVLFF